jgi:arginyl-tRNA synthetase
MTTGHSTATIHSPGQVSTAVLQKQSGTATYFAAQISFGLEKLKTAHYRQMT